MNVAVYCSSSNHIAEKYKKSAYQLGEWLALNGHTLVFGGATGGLMDAVAEGAFSKNGQITGVISQTIVLMDRQSPFCSELIKVKTLNDRKAKMKELADVFVVLPGSFGTLDEMLDVVTSGIVHEHKKPLVILNQEGFYNHFLNQIELMRNEQFIPAEQSYIPNIVQNLENCFKLITQFESLR